MARRSRNQEQNRRRIAVEAGRLISESGLRDYGLAKRRAAERLGLPTQAGLPSNIEVEEALREHQRLFQRVSQPEALRRLREAAVEALRFFARFEPRLVGAVLEGTADEHSAVCLHLYSDQPHEILARLQEQGIPYEEQDRALRLNPNASATFPALVFEAGGVAMDLTLLPYDLLRQAPLDRVSERPMQRAGVDRVLELLGE